jgi:hypothetical protein
MAVAMAVLSLGPRLHVAGHETPISLPWRLAAHLPILDNVLPSRLSAYVLLAVALLLACGVGALLQERRRAVQVGGTLAVALSLVAVAPAAPLGHRAATAPPFFTSPAARALPQGSVAYVLPLVNPDDELWQLDSGMRFRLTGGWFFSPDARGHLQNGPSSTPLSRAVNDIESSGDIVFLSPQDVAAYRAELRGDQVRIVVVTPLEPHAWTVAQFFQRVTGTPAHDDGAGTLYFTGF